jgi:uncharacterized protein involved in response to NO
VRHDSSMELHGKTTDPYRVFFPLGIILGVMGVAIWPLYYYGFTEGYSGRAHAFVQIDGFLYSFIIGFLLTAIPRFTGTEPPALPVQYTLATIVGISALALEFQFFALGQTGFLIAHGMLIVLAARRFRRRQLDPPDTFVLAGLGLVSGAIGGLINAAITWNAIAPLWDPLGKRMMTEGMVLLLVLGIGGFLGPRLLGFAQLPQFAKIGSASTPPNVKTPAFYLLAGLVVLFSIIGQYGFGLPWMAFLRAAAATAVILSTVKPWHLPSSPTTLARCVWAAHWLVILAVWLVAISPRYSVDLLHILFIGGFTLLIFAVGTRVTLSHGGHGLQREQRSWPLRIGVTTGLIAMLARVGAPLAGFTYFEHLALAALLWIGGVSFWGFHLLRIIRSGSSSQT